MSAGMRTPSRIRIITLRSTTASDCSSFSTAQRRALTLSARPPPRPCAPARGGAAVMSGIRARNCVKRRMYALPGRNGPRPRRAGAARLTMVLPILASALNPSRGSSPSERLLEAVRLRRKQFGPRLRDQHVVLETDAELAGDVNAGLVAEHHTGLEFERVTAHEVRPFVSVHPHAVTHPVGEVSVSRA